MTKEELLALLREAQPHVAFNVARNPQTDTGLLARIDAALAEHEAEVLFKHGVAQLGWLRLHTYGPNPDGTWTWSICLKDDDICSDATYATEDEAKAAAIAAAKGMK